MGTLLKEMFPHY